MSARNYPPGRDTAFELLCDCSIFNFERAIFDQSKWSRAVNLSKMPPSLGEKILWVYSFPGELNIIWSRYPLTMPSQPATFIPGGTEAGS